MKQILLLLIGVVLFTSCERTATETKTNGNIVTQVNTYGSSGALVSAQFEIHKFEYEGHTYLYFMETSGHQGFGGLTHDENCKCCTK